MLDEIIPFRYLPPSLRARAAADASERAYDPGDILIVHDDAEDSRVFLLLEGTVRMADPRYPGSLGRIVLAGHYFGERASLFGEPRDVQVQAIDHVRVLTIPGQRFLELVRESTAFSQALGSILRDKQGVFREFDRFRVELEREVAGGSVDLRKLLRFYRRLEPALHPGATSWDTIDIGALSYAVRRLPENLTRTLSFYLTESLPALYSDPDERFSGVATDARRRAVYEMMPGKNMVLVRDGLSDLLDFISCLCLYSIEARKIRRRVRDHGALDAIPPDVAALLEAVWPGEAEARVRELALHHEDFRIEVHKELNNYNSAHAEAWNTQIAGATHELLGYDPADLPEGFAVHIVSSNTHSVHNCLSPWIGRNAKRMLAWARQAALEGVDDVWEHEHDLAYSIARTYLATHPDEALERVREEREAGILTLDDTSFTGIKVQLIDASRIKWHEADPGIPDHPPAGPALIVNIDYAFGEQAEHIIANLTALFGRSLSSVNVLGKAGGLVGERGGMLVATGFVDQVRDHFHPIPRRGRIDVDRLRRRLPDREVHEGHMLTVPGTLLQNRRMLHFHRHIWRCIGLEMEGAFYLRPVLQSMDRGAIPTDVAFRFLYYTSDLPLRHDANLSSPMRAAEGIPPLYAITRELLSAILEAEPR